VANSPEYFAALQRAIEDPRAQVEFFQQMRDLDIRGFHFGSNIPNTQYRSELQDEHIPVTHAFLREMLEPNWRGFEAWEFPSKSLFEQLKAWLAETNNRQAQFVTRPRPGETRLSQQKHA